MLERERKIVPERERRKKLPYGPQFINISTKLKFAKLGIESENSNLPRSLCFSFSILKRTFPFCDSILSSL